MHRQAYDAIVCMDHDQGQGPMNLLAFEDAVNVTFGLPIYPHLGRSWDSVRHRVEGKASHRSLHYALDYA